MLNSCPDCDKPIRADAFRCSCGWVKPASEVGSPQHIECAYHGCGTSATVRVKKPTGWANLCVHHYAQDNVQESKEYCRKHGLDTTEKKIAHIRKLLSTPRNPRAWMKNPKSDIARQYRDEVLRHVAERVPGEDDEPLAEAA